MNKITNSQVFRENIRGKLQDILCITDDSISVNLEKGVFNYALHEAGRKKIVKKWENPQFVTIYIDRLRSVYMNLKSETLLL